MKGKRSGNDHVGRQTAILLLGLLGVAVGCLELGRWFVQLPPEWLSQNLMGVIAVIVGIGFVLVTVVAMISLRRIR